MLLVRRGVRTPENIHRVQQEFMQSPRLSVKRLSQLLNFGASSTYRIIREGAMLFAYTIQMQQAVLVADK
jgi:hypothetical protein